MSKKKYSVGDVFEIPLDDRGNKGYGRILKVDKSLTFIEFYKLVRSPESTNSLSAELVNRETCLQIWTTDEGIKKGLWTLVDHVPVHGEVRMPDFWQEDLLSDKLWLIRDDKKRFETNEEEIKSRNAQPFGVFGYEAARIVYVKELNKHGVFGSTP